MRGFTQALAEEVASQGVRVQAIFPDVTDTPMLDRSTLADRLGTPMAPQRVADLVIALWTMPADARVIEPVLMPARRPESRQSNRHVPGRG